MRNDEERAPDIVVHLDMGRSRPPVETAELRLKKVGEIAREVLGTLNITVLEVVVRREPGDLGFGFEVELTGLSGTLSRALEAVEDIAELVCTGCVREGLPLSDGYGEVRVQSKYMYSSHN
jgi:hypothetical protein